MGVGIVIIVEPHLIGSRGASIRLKFGLGFRFKSVSNQDILSIVNK